MCLNVIFEQYMLNQIALFRALENRPVLLFPEKPHHCCKPWCHVSLVSCSWKPLQECRRPCWLSPSLTRHAHTEPKGNHFPMVLSHPAAMCSHTSTCFFYAASTLPQGRVAVKWERPKQLTTCTWDGMWLLGIWLCVFIVFMQYEHWVNGISCIMLTMVIYYTHKEFWIIRLFLK